MRYSIIVKLVQLVLLFFCFACQRDVKEDVPVFDIHFAVLTERAEELRNADIGLFEKEVAILNRYFVSAGKREIVRFRYKSGVAYDQVKGSNCLFVKEIVDAEAYHDAKRLKELYNECNDRKVRDPAAINFYIYDAYSPRNGFSDKTSRGYNNSSRPFLMLDWERIGHAVQSPEEHEMGHAFGLEHVCEQVASSASHTNIMASAGGDCEGSGGLRDIGFTEQQIAVILRHARKISQNLDNGVR